MLIRICTNGSRRKKLKRRDNEWIRRALGKAYWFAGEQLHCHWCEVVVSRLDELTVDHLVPRWLGGAHDPSNAVLACVECNGLRDAWDRYDAGLQPQPKQEW